MRNPDAVRASAPKRDLGGVTWASARRRPLLAADEPAAVRVINATGQAPVLLTCDHASPRVPYSLTGLGMAAGDLNSHVGWDPGAAAVTLQLSDRFDAPAVLSAYSRLVVDCNREPGSEEAIPEASHGVRVPGNAGLTPGDARVRHEALFRPYHAAISAALDRIRGRGVEPVLVAVHTFTPRLNGFDRPWHVGILWDEDGRLAKPLIAALRCLPGMRVGDNEPYSGRDSINFSQRFHATSRGIPSALVEIRSDLVRSKAGLSRHSGLLGDALERALARLPGRVEPI